MVIFKPTNARASVGAFLFDAQIRAAFAKYNDRIKVTALNTLAATTAEAARLIADGG